MLIVILLATLIVSLISFIGVVFFFKKTERGEKWLKNLISLAAGTLLATAFFHLLPEAIEESKFSSKTLLSLVLFSILFFFIIEKYLHWHHCRCENNEGHGSKKNYKNFIYTNLTGDAIHNFIDGSAIAASFLISPLTGLITTLTIILHEIPQEISDFGILLYGGMTRKRALFINFLTALTALLGALIFYYFGEQFSQILPLMLAFTAGNFIYLATADLIPEIHEEKIPARILSNTLWLILGVVLIISFVTLLPTI